MRCPLADNAAPAVPAVSSDHATPAVGSLRVPLKPGPKRKDQTAGEKREYFRLASQAHRKKKKTAIAALTSRAENAEQGLRECQQQLDAAGADNVKLAGALVRAAAEIRRLRDLLADRQIDAMVTALEAEVPRADLHGEGTVV